MNPSFVDHLIAFTLIAVIPIAQRWSYPKLREKVRSDPGARRRGYRSTIWQQWALVAFVLAVWFAQGRAWAAIGLVVPSGIRTYIGIGLTAAVVVALRWQIATVRRGGEEAREAIRAQIGPVDELIPRTATEARWFRGVSFTAGICEEILYRGFLIAYLGVLLGTWPAVAAGALFFGVAHIYLGRANAWKSGVIALVLGAMYVACGSLVWPMIIHAAIDLTAGTLGRLAIVGPTPDD